MSFKLPNGNDLTKEQLDIINLPTNQDWVIEGAPGTGKTVMAVYRAGQMPKKKKVLVLVYNRPLKDFIHTAISDEHFENCTISTYHQWLADMYKEHFRSSGYPKEGDFDPKWSQIKSDFHRFSNYYDQVIVDEAQDFPIQLIEILKEISKNITCFIDPNQTIEPGKTDRVLMLKSLLVECPYKLTYNFRNTKPIRDASALFCREGAPAEAYMPGPKPCLIKCRKKGRKPDFDDQTQKMCQIIRRNLDKNIGVIVNARSLRATYESLMAELEDEIDIQMHKACTSHKIDFEIDGVQIVSFGTMKGLEFDIVLIPGFDYIKPSGDAIVDGNVTYVAMSRPLRELYLFYFNTKHVNGRLNTMGVVADHNNLFLWK